MGIYRCINIYVYIYIHVHIWIHTNMHTNTDFLHRFNHAASAELDDGAKRCLVEFPARLHESNNVLGHLDLQSLNGFPHRTRAYIYIPTGIHVHITYSNTCPFWWRLGGCDPYCSPRPLSLPPLALAPNPHRGWLAEYVSEFYDVGQSTELSVGAAPAFLFPSGERTAFPFLYYKSRVKCVFLSVAHCNDVIARNYSLVAIILSRGSTPGDPIWAWPWFLCGKAGRPYSTIWANRFSFRRYHAITTHTHTLTHHTYTHTRTLAHNTQWPFLATQNGTISNSITNFEAGCSPLSLSFCISLACSLSAVPFACSLFFHHLLSCFVLSSHPLTLCLSLARSHELSLSLPRMRCLSLFPFLSISLSSALSRSPSLLHHPSVRLLRIHPHWPRLQRKMWSRPPIVGSMLSAAAWVLAVKSAAATVALATTAAQKLPGRSVMMRNTPILSCRHCFRVGRGEILEMRGRTSMKIFWTCFWISMVGRREHLITLCISRVEKTWNVYTICNT